MTCCHNLLAIKLPWLWLHEFQLIMDLKENRHSNSFKSYSLIFYWERDQNNVPMQFTWLLCQVSCYWTCMLLVLLFLTQSSIAFFQLRCIVTVNLSPSFGLMSITIFLNASAELGDNVLSTLLKWSISYVLMLLLIWLHLIATCLSERLYFHLPDDSKLELNEVLCHIDLCQCE